MYFWGRVATCVYHSVQYFFKIWRDSTGENLASIYQHYVCMCGWWMVCVERERERERYRQTEKGSFEGAIPLVRAKEASHSEWYSNAISRHKDFVKFALLWNLAAYCLCPLYWAVYSPSVWEDEKTTQMKKGRITMLSFKLHFGFAALANTNNPGDIRLLDWHGHSRLPWARFVPLTSWTLGRHEVGLGNPLSLKTQQVACRASDYVFKDHFWLYFQPFHSHSPEAFNADHFTTGIQTPALLLNGINRLTT